jgi:hypothetical protein
MLLVLRDTYKIFDVFYLELKAMYRLKDDGHSNIISATTNALPPRRPERVFTCDSC